MSVKTSGPSTARTRRLRDRLVSSPYSIDIERARSYTAVWREADPGAPSMRAARALERALSEMTIRIDDDELLAGVKTFKDLAGVIPVERGEFNTVLELELDRLVSRDRHRFIIEDQERRELEREILPYWRGKTVRDRKVSAWKEGGIFEKQSLGLSALHRILKGAGGRTAAKIGYLAMGRSVRSVTRIPRMREELAGLWPNLALTVFDVQGHFVPGYRRVLEMGFEGIARKASEGLSILEPSEDDYGRRRDFLQSVEVVCRAVDEYAGRYSELAGRLAPGAEPGRRRELEQMAERCRRVPMKPPTDFMEAMQSLWMTQVVLSISYGMAGVMSPGRVDQYLYPYYSRDLAEGRITRDKALEVIEEYLVKLGTYLIMLIEVGKDTASEMAVGSNTFTVGGVDREGNDATNELSHVFIEAHDNVRALANNISVRISRSTPEDFLRKACASYRETSGLALFNDDLIIGELVSDGFSLEDARDYSIVGCVEPTSTGNCFACTAGNDISLAGVLEMALNQGAMLFSGGRVGARTPDPRRFEGFGDVKEAFARQLSFNVDKLVRAVEMLDLAYAGECPSPAVSATVEGCLESARDVTLGGARYNFGSITGRGLGTVANSLAAIRWAVFEEGILSMGELMDLLHRNFRGAEDIRSELARRAPKYGNDEAGADEMAAWVMDIFSREVRKHLCGRGGFYRPGMFSYGVHVVDGLSLGATPDGRLAGEPVSNGISPVNGTERNGPTAVMRSAATAASAPISDGTALNMRLAPGLLGSGESVEKLASLVRGYFSLGGRHVQFNVVDTETLEDAQRNPERYPDLVVRVSGYCAYFTDLGRSIQDDIIARTNFGSIG
jgi:pyruvate formate-lyase/glycerol dehydratase family glycyl radical enzyme